MTRIRKRLIVCLATLLASSPALAAAPYTMYASAPQAGQPIRLTVNRADTSADATVILSTKDNTALVNADYQFSSVMVTFAKQQVSATILIPTYVDPAKYGQTLKVGLIASVGSTAVASMLTSIVQPAAPPGGTVSTPGGIVTSWVDAPLTVGGYACNALQENTPNVGPCGSSIVYRITGTTQSADTPSVTLYTAVYAQDASGNFPASDTYARDFVGYWPAAALHGIAPAKPIAWQTAPITSEGYVRAKIATSGWPKGQNPDANKYDYSDVYRSAEAGEVFRIYKNGGGYSWDNRVTYSMRSLKYGDTVILYADDIEGVKAL